MNVVYAKSRAKRAVLHAEDGKGDPLCGQRSRNVRLWLRDVGEPTCKGCIKKLAALPVTIERQGTTRSGGRYFMQVMVSGMTINGQAIPNELAARAMADKLESGFGGTSHQRALPAPGSDDDSDD